MPSRFALLILCCVLSALLQSACGGTQPAAAPEVRASTTDVNAFLQEALAGPALTYDELVTRLGSPVRVEAAPAALAGGAASGDTMRTVIYYGLEVGLHEASSSRLAHFALTDARYTSPEGLRVGYAESQVVSALGLPTRREPARLIYEQEGAGRYVLVVFLERRAVSRLEWTLTHP